MTETQNLERAGRDAGALDAATAAGGDGAPATLPEPNGTGATDTVEMGAELVEELEEALRDVVDPELGVNIVDLGLVYDLHLSASNVLTIDMTLTSAACPLTDMIEDQINAALMTPPGDQPTLIDGFVINWVWLPPWGPERITDDGREQLRALGFNI